MKSKAVLLSLVAVLTLSACGGVDPNSPAGKRQAAFQEILKVSENLTGMFRGRINYDADKFRAGATELERLSHTPWQYFPKVQEGEQGRASDEIWQRQEQFHELARDFEAASLALMHSADAEPETQRRAEQEKAMQRVEDSCKACHQVFRSY